MDLQEGDFLNGSHLAVEAGRLNEILSLVPVGVYTCDASGRITFYNAKAVELWGRTPALNDSRETFCACYKVFAPDGSFVPPDQTPMARAVRDGESFRNVEALVERPDGSRFHASVNVAPIRDETGAVTGAINVFQDVSSLRQATDALRDREQILHDSQDRIAADIHGITLLYEVGNFCVRPGAHFDQCLNKILDAAIRVTRAQKGDIQLLEPSSGALLIVAHSGFEKPFLDFFNRVVHGDAASCEAAKHTQQRVIVEDVTQSPIFDDPAALKVMLAAGARACQSTPLLSSTGKLLGVISTHFTSPCRPDDRDLGLMDLLARQAADCIERKAAEEASTRLAAIVDQSDDAIVSKDLDGIIQSWNHGAERLFGYTAAEIVGKSVTLLIPPDRAEEEPGILDRIRRGKRIEHYETIRRRKDGSLLDISLTVSPIRDASGHIVGASKIARDITDRKRAETALRRSEGLFRELADLMPQIVWTARPDGRVDYCNSRWYEYTGFPHGSFNDAAWKSILHPEDFERWANDHLECIRQGRTCQMEYRLKDRRNDGYRWFLERVETVCDDSGKPVRWIGTCTDIDDQKRAAEILEKAVADRTASLREAIAQMEEFSYTVSHDLRAPLRAMQVYSDVLLQDFAHSLPDEAGYCLTRIARNSSLLDHMITDVLTFTRVARTEFKLEKVSVDRLVRQIVEQYPGMQPPRADVRIKRLPDVLGHTPSLIQALSNLLNNAVKFVPPNVTPRIRVWSERVNGNVRLVVGDNGIGIDPRYTHRLFRMFERVHPELDYEGTGVGLAIVRKAAERMGGTVGVESDGSNGSRFWIELRSAEQSHD